MNTYAQKRVFKGNPDKAFKIARELAFNKHRAQAQDSLRLILTKYPNYHDIRAFLGSTYSWDGAYKKARKEFEYVLKRAPKRKTTWIAAINNELWGEQAQKAYELTIEGLKLFPQDKDLWFLKVKALVNNKKEEDALIALNLLLNKYPNFQKAKDYKSSLKYQLSSNEIGLKASYEEYSKVFNLMQYYALSYNKQTKLGSIIARVNYANKFKSNGYQYVIDLYPRIKEGMYAYLSYGLSNSSLYPNYRYGAELYTSLPKGLEASLGMRALNYGNGTTYIYTGSVGWYTGNYYLYIRPYFTPNDTGISKSGTFNIRRYGKDADTYFRIYFGFGYSPQIDRFVTDNQKSIIKINSQQIGVNYYFSTNSRKNRWGTNFSVAHQELSFSPGEYMYVYSFGINYYLKFK